MKTLFFRALISFSVLSCAGQQQVNLTQSDASAIQVVPTVQDFRADGAADFKLDAALINIYYAAGLDVLANNLASDIEALTGTSVMSTAASSCAAKPNSICISGPMNHDSNAPFATEQGYALSLSASEGLSLTGSGHTGVIFGTQTILQLIALQKTGIGMPSGTITDSPNYKERSVMLDVGRKYFSVPYIQSLIRLMAYYKMNFLHLHFTDWSAFRLKADAGSDYAALVKVDSFYDKGDVEVILETADKYGISIIPEIDVPAHSTAITDANPALKFPSDCVGMNNFKPQGAEKPGWTLDVTNSATQPYVEGLVEYFLPWFQNTGTQQYQGKYFHMGGDEWPTNDIMNACPALLTACAGNVSCDCPDNKAPLVGCQPVEKYAPGGLFVDFLNNIDNHVFQKKEINPTKTQMRMWTGWNAATNTGSLVKYGISSVQPNTSIVIDSWLLHQDPDNLLTNKYKVNNASVEMVYLTPGMAFSKYDFPPPQSYLYSRWVPNIYQMKNNVAGEMAYTANSNNFLGSGLLVWADNSSLIPVSGKNIPKPELYFDALLQRPLKLIANTTWNAQSNIVNNKAAKIKACEIDVTPFVERLAQIGEPPGYTLPEDVTYKMKNGVVQSVGKGQKIPLGPLINYAGKFDLPVPWTISATVTITDADTTPLATTTLMYLVTSLIPNTVLPEPGKPLNAPDQFSLDIAGHSGQIGYTNGKPEEDFPSCSSVGRWNVKLADKTFQFPKSGTITFVGDRSGVSAYVNGNLVGSDWKVMSLPMTYIGSVLSTNAMTVSDLTIRTRAVPPTKN